ncbi:MAG: hypothetical protein WC797_00745 [Candidatus Paceibacterota bacterium]|jgi:hypothetical protein
MANEDSARNSNKATTTKDTPASGAGVSDFALEILSWTEEHPLDLDDEFNNNGLDSDDIDHNGEPRRG